MDEQSPNERQPKVRRAGNSGAEEPRLRRQCALLEAGAARADVSEKRSRAGEEASPATDSGVRQVESVLPWPFQATYRALDEWTHFSGRAVDRNARAAGDLRACRSVASVLRWQRELVQGNVEDWLQTSFAVFGVCVQRVPHTQAASETARA
jgi:hypothetical protein